MAVIENRHLNNFVVEFLFHFCLVSIVCLICFSFRKFQLDKMPRLACTSSRRLRDTTKNDDDETAELVQLSAQIDTEDACGTLHHLRANVTIDQAWSIE